MWLSEDKLIGDSVTIVTTDGSIIKGSRPIVNTRSFVLYLKQADDSALLGDNTIPFAMVSTISYRKPSPARRWITALGFGLGALGGAAAGAALASDTSDPAFGEASMGAFLGLIVGTALGYTISKNMTTEVTLNCR